MEICSFLEVTIAGVNLATLFTVSIQKIMFGDFRSQFLKADQIQELAIPVCSWTKSFGFSVAKETIWKSSTIFGRLICELMSGFKCFLKKTLIYISRKQGVDKVRLFSKEILLYLVVFTQCFKNLATLMFLRLKRQCGIWFRIIKNLNKCELIGIRQASHNGHSHLWNALITLNHIFRSLSYSIRSANQSRL